MKPTEEQQEKLWKWCGWRRVPEGKKAFHYERCQKVMNWYAPDNQERSYKSLPPIDLNNLFKWAVPKWIKTFPHSGGCQVAYRIETPLFVSLSKADSKNNLGNLDEEFALALFWAINNIFNKEVKQ